MECLTWYQIVLVLLCHPCGLYDSTLSLRPCITVGNAQAIGSSQHPDFLQAGDQLSAPHGLKPGLVDPVQVSPGNCAPATLQDAVYSTWPIYSNLGTGMLYAILQQL